MTNIKFFAAGALALTLAAPVAAQTAIIGYDVDGDGMLTGAELRDALSKAERFPQFDINGDGVLTEEEFATYYNGIRVENDGAPMALADYDDNNDGVLSPVEYNDAVMAGYDLNGDGALDMSELVDLEEDLSDDIRFDG